LKMETKMEKTKSWSDILLEMNWDKKYSTQSKKTKEHNLEIVEKAETMPQSLLSIPGFVDDLMNYCLQSAPYPNKTLAFCGAVGLLSFLTGRKIADISDNRTNIYLLGLANSGAGKDWPRKINAKIMIELGLSSSIGDKFASGEGIQDALFDTPSMFFQTDEIDGLLQSINKSKDARHESLMGTLLTIFSSSNSIFPMRRKAGQPFRGNIYNPHLVIFGTAIPNHYYDALSERMLTNGFFSRMIVLESESRNKGKFGEKIVVPKNIMDTVRFWIDFKTGYGDLEKLHPIPVVVEYSDMAKVLLSEAQVNAESEYSKAERKNNSVGMVIWSRAIEHIMKLSLLFAASNDPHNLIVDASAVQWATEFVMIQVKRMLFMAQSHVAENPFHSICLKALKKIFETNGAGIAHSSLLKKMKLDAKTFSGVIDTLKQSGDIEMVNESTGGMPRTIYKLTA
jgi:hypothetical protein